MERRQNYEMIKNKHNQRDREIRTDIGIPVIRQTPAHFARFNLVEDRIAHLDADLVL